MNKTITIIGCGLGGCYLAILLLKRGYKVKIYEKFSREDICDINSKRSYNITFRTNGIAMLKEADLWEELQSYMLPLKGAYTKLSKNAKPIVSLLQDGSVEYIALARADLLEVMLKRITNHPSASVHFNTSLLSIDRYTKIMIVQDNTTKKMTTVPCDLIIGADGINSTVRMFIQQGQNTHHTQDYSSGGYKQFTITKEQVRELDLRPDLAYTWSSDCKFILAFPNADGSLASLLIYPQDKKVFDSLRSSEAIKKLIENDFPCLSKVSGGIGAQIIENPLGNFVTVHTDPWYYKDFMTLIGDAAHGFYPFFGQGTTAAFGDGLQLLELANTYNDEWNKILPAYQKKRKKHMDALGELSKEGLMRYMRNKRADYTAIYEKLEEVGHNFFPKYIHPPVFQLVMDEPRYTADYVEKHIKQRKIAKKMGVSIAVVLLTKIVGIYEHIFS